MRTELLVQIGVFTEDGMNNLKRTNINFQRAENFSLKSLDYGIDWLQFYNMEAKQLEVPYTSHAPVLVGQIYIKTNTYNQL